MGTYTEIYVNVDLIPCTPDEVLDKLRLICYDDNPSEWSHLFRSNSYYTPNTSCRMLTFDSICGLYSLLAKGDVRDTRLSDFEAFIAWLTPWIDAKQGEFIGYSRSEESEVPTWILKSNAI